ncbi:MAG: thioredoxin [Marinicaulis sp.]|nr:hypothetical protein [Marinicaulis sp.]NNL87986.1 thioredoxin [Marinicaulis sp.]
MKKRLKNLLFPAIVVIGIGVFAMSDRGSASDAEYTYQGEPEVIAATFASAWCSSCKILKPRLADVIPEFSDKPVKFIEFDFTFGQRDEIDEQAAQEGVSDLYKDYKGATGFTLLIDKDTGEILDSLTMNHSSKAMRSAIAQSIAIASRDDGNSN